MPTQKTRQEIIDSLTACGNLSYKNMIDFVYSILFLNDPLLEDLDKAITTDTLDQEGKSKVIDIANFPYPATPGVLWTDSTLHFTSNEVVTNLTIKVTADSVIKVITGSIIPNEPFVNGTSLLTKTSELNLNLTAGIDDYTVNIPVSSGEYLLFLTDASNGLFYRMGSVGNQLVRFATDTTGSLIDQVVDSSELGIGYRCSDSESAKKEKLIQFIRDNQNTSNYLLGKKFGINGDSNARGHTLPLAQAWASLVADRNSMVYTNYAINGGRLTDTDGSPNALVLRYGDMSNDLDIIVFEIGTNDQQAGVDIGADDDAVTTTFKGALNILCTGALNKWPNKKILFVSPQLRVSGAPSQPYVDAMIKICSDKYSIPVFNSIKNGGLCWSNATQVNAITLSDTFHRNEEGMKLKSYTLEQAMRAI